MEPVHHKTAHVVLEALKPEWFVIENGATEFKIRESAYESEADGTPEVIHV